MMHPGFGRAASRFFLLLFSFSAAGARAQNGNLMLADFEGGKVETVAGLAFPVIADEQVGGTSTATLTLIHPGARASGGALRISFRVTDDDSQPFSSTWAPLGEQGLATDLSPYNGLRFYARGQSGSFVAGLARFTGVSTRYMLPFELKPEWTLVELPFGKFEKAIPSGSPLPFAAKDVVFVGFSVASQQRGQLDLEIDQVEFYK